MKKIFILSLIFSIAVNVFGQVNETIPDIVENGPSVGDEISVMLTSDELSGLGVIAFQFTIEYDASVVVAGIIDGSVKSFPELSVGVNF